MKDEGIKFLNSRLLFGINPGLESTRKICEELGNPEKKFKTIHIVGTNGKGSTSFYLANILHINGYKTGLYTSPHLVNLRERIRINNIPINESDLEKLLVQVKKASIKASHKSILKDGYSIEPTFFEVLTIVSFLYYAQQKVDVVVMEAGLGGRLDSSAIANGNIIIITSIGLEHTEILGNTKNQILKEKMGIAEAFKNATDKIFILGNLNKALLDTSKKYAHSINAKIIIPKIRKDLTLLNIGKHYVENASLSLKAAELFINQDKSNTHHFNLKKSINILKKISWVGRMQSLTDKNAQVKIILDGAHNSHAVQRLVETIKDTYPNKKFNCLFGALKDKDVKEMLKLMNPYINNWFITKTSYNRFRDLKDLHTEMKELGLNVLNEGELNLKFLRNVLKQNFYLQNSKKEPTPLLITGSLYLIGACINLLKNDFEELQFFRNLEETTNENHLFSTKQPIPQNHL